MSTQFTNRQWRLPNAWNGSESNVNKQSNYSMDFDGSSQYISFGSSSSLLTTGGFSVSWWMKTTVTADDPIILMDDWASGNRNWKIESLSSSSVIRFYVFASTNVIVLANTSINDGNWHHLLATYDGTSNADGLKLYVDGGTPFTATASSTGIRSTSSAEATIGATSGGGAFRLEGTVDEVAIWNSDQSANASAIYNSGAPNDISSLSPLSWWRMGDGDTAPILTDNGSASNDGTMTFMSSANFVPDVPT